MALEDKFEMEEYRAEDIEINNSYIKDDVEYAKKNIRDMIDESLKLLPSSVRIAKESESPRSVEVVSGLISAISSLNRDLISLTPAKKETEASITNQQNNNNFFIGSTEDLFSQLHRLPEKIVIEKD